MIPEYLSSITLNKFIREDDKKFFAKDRGVFDLPQYAPRTHYLDLTKSKYFEALVFLRHYIKLTSDYYFSVEQKAKNVDLFMLTPSVSSPMGPGSDSEAIPIKFGTLNSYLVDSSQFGFEPLLLNGIEKVYCYLPSMRGEDPDKRHLNQFFHCEAEIQGDIKKLIPIIEGFVRRLSHTTLLMKNIVNNISLDPLRTRAALEKILASKSFPEMSFDEAVDTLVKNGKGDLVNFSESGRDISSKGELELMKIIEADVPIWIKNYDRNRVPFYQKPHPENTDKVINADLLFPPLLDGSFGGEVVGCGQRQDNEQEMRESLDRQGISPDPYLWYINLRSLPNYKTTSGFGIGIERFITWALCRDNIRDAILYPRLKNTLTFP